MRKINLRNKRAFPVVCLLFVFFGLSLLVCGCGRKEIRNIYSRADNIICFGDSITFGSGAGESQDYPSLLGKSLRLPVINAGVAGDTTSTALKRIKTDVLDKDPLLVIVELGGNDFLSRIPPEDTLKNIDEIVRLIQEQGAMVILLDIKANFLMAAYTNGYKRIAQQRGAVFIAGILSKILASPNLKSDYIHPNSEGYKLIADELLRIVLPIIERNKALRLKNNF